MNELQIKGNQNFMGKEIPVVEGGFGENQKVMLAKTIAEIHETELRIINQTIQRHIDEFEIGIDLLDLKNSITECDSLLNGIYTKQQIANSKNIYLLSEQGYMLLAGFMNTEKAKEIRKQLRREYFTMREVINSSEQLKAMTLLKAVESTGEESIVAIKQYTDLRIQEETRPLLDKIEEDKPKVTFADRVLKSKDNILIRQLAKIASDEGFTIGEKKLYNKLREWGYICKNSTEPTQIGMDRGYFVVKVGTVDTPYRILETRTTLVTPKGQVHIVEKLLKEVENNN